MRGGKELTIPTMLVQVESVTTFTTAQKTEILGILIKINSSVSWLAALFKRDKVFFKRCMLAETLAYKHRRPEQGYSFHFNNVCNKKGGKDSQ